MENSITPKTIDSSYAWHIWQDSWEAIRGRRVLFFFAALIPAILGVVISVTPLIGMPIAGFLNPFLGAGFILLVHNYMSKKEFDFNTIFEGLANKEVFFKILPLSVFLFFFNGMLSLVNMAMSITGGFMGLIIITISSLIISIFTYFSIPLLLFKKLKLFEAMSLSSQALGVNIIVFFLYSLGMFIVMTIAAIPLGIGLILLFAPFSAHGYLLYKKIFEAEQLL